jgi:hypothetical protein
MNTPKGTTPTPAAPAAPITGGPATPPEPTAPPSEPGTMEPTYHNIDDAGKEVSFEIKFGRLADIFDPTRVLLPAPDNTLVEGDFCIAWTDIGMEGLPSLSITSHRKTEIAAIDALMYALRYAYEVYGLAPIARGQTGRPNNQTQSAAPAAGAKQAGPQKPGSSNAAPQRSGVAPAAPAAPTQPAAPGNEQFDPNVTHEYKIVMIEIKPQSDGKIAVDFFGPGHNYPDIYAKWTPEQALGYLNQSGWVFSAEHFARVAKYTDLDFVVKWVYSEKRNSKGNQYKNITSITPS